MKNKLPLNRRCLICNKKCTEKSIYQHLKSHHDKPMKLGKTYEVIKRGKKSEKTSEKSGPASISFTDSSILIRIPVIIGKPEIVS